MTMSSEGETCRRKAVAMAPETPAPETTAPETTVADAANLNDQAADGCPTGTALVAYVEGQGSPEIETHARGCRRCAARIEALREDLAFLQSHGTELRRAVQASRPAGAAFPDELQIEGYELVRELHRGGQGVVYEAVQRATKRRVALKVLLHGSLATSAQRRRFEREVELVARLRHPNIVSILESGVDRGRYYFVMEYIHEQSLPETFPHGVAPIREGTRLMAQVVSAVDHAHQRGVLHRDLKPANIVLDETGTPRLVDFGVGRLLEQEFPEAGGATLSQPGSLLGTVAYMSPEQACGRIDEVGIRSDVYALGVIFFELLTGGHPYVTAGPLHEVVANIVNATPRRASALRSEVPSDLDAILLKALEKSPQDRYPTAGLFAEDMRRFLRGETVIARPLPVGQRARRWAHRHRGGLSAAGLIVLAMSALGVAAFLRARGERDRAVIAEQRARVEASVARGTADFLADLLGSSTLAASGHPETVAELVARGVAETRTVNDSSLRALLLDALGTVERDRGNLPAADELLSESLALRRTHLGADDPDVARSLNLLGGLREVQGRFAEAEVNYREALGILRRAGMDAREIANTLRNLASSVNASGRAPEAEQLLRESIRLRESSPQPRADVTGGDLQLLGWIVFQQQRYVESETLFGQALEQFAVSAGKHSERYASCLQNLAGALGAQADFAAAEELYGRVVELRIALHGEHSPQLVESYYYRALARLKLRRTDEAIHDLERCSARAAASQQPFRISAEEIATALQAARAAAQTPR